MSDGRLKKNGSIHPPYDPGPRSRGEDQHPIAEGDRLLQVVGDEHDRLAFLLPEGQQVVLHQLTGVDVKRAERLVHQEDRGPDDQVLSERHPLAHPAGELVRVAGLEPPESHAGEPPPGLIGRASARPAVEEGPSITFSRTVFHGSRTSCWKR